MICSLHHSYLKGPSPRSRINRSVQERVHLTVVVDLILSVRTLFSLFLTTSNKFLFKINSSQVNDLLKVISPRKHDDSVKVWANQLCLFKTATTLSRNFYMYSDVFVCEWFVWCVDWRQYKKMVIYFPFWNFFVVAQQQKESTKLVAEWQDTKRKTVNFETVMNEKRANQAFSEVVSNVSLQKSIARIQDAKEFMVECSTCQGCDDDGVERGGRYVWAEACSDLLVFWGYYKRIINDIITVETLKAVIVVVDTRMDFSDKVRLNVCRNRRFRLEAVFTFPRRRERRKRRRVIIWRWVWCKTRRRRRRRKWQRLLLVLITFSRSRNRERRRRVFSVLSVWLVWNVLRIFLHLHLQNHRTVNDLRSVLDMTMTRRWGVSFDHVVDVTIVIPIETKRWSTFASGWCEWGYCEIHSWS